MTRICRRNGCARPAAATLTFRYDTAQAWLSDLAAEPEPQRWDLCPSHGSKLTVPMGWELVDARTDANAPTARQTTSARHNRYAELSAQLPELAAQMTSSSPLLRRDGPDTDSA